MSEDNKEYKIMFDNGVGYLNGLTEDNTELEDRIDYILEEDKETVNKYIEELQKRIRQLKCEIAHLQGQNEVWEKSWRIWNGEEGQ